MQNSQTQQFSLVRINNEQWAVKARTAIVIGLTYMGPRYGLGPWKFVITGINSAGIPIAVTDETKANALYELCAQSGVIDYDANLYVVQDKLVEIKITRGLKEKC